MAHRAVLVPAQQLANLLPLGSQPQQLRRFGQSFQLVKGLVHLRRLAMMRRKTAIRIQQNLPRGHVLQQP